MSSIVTIIAVSVGAGLISLAIFVACAGFLLLDAIGKGLGGRSAMGGWETPLASRLLGSVDFSGDLPGRCVFPS